MAPSQFYPSWRQHVAASGELNLTSRNFARAPQDENASPEQDKPVTTADEQPSAPPAVTPPPAEAAPPKQDKAENTAAPQFEQPATKPPQENPSPKQESPTATTANPQSESPAAKSVSENAPPRRQKAAKGADPLLESPPASSPAAVLPTVQSLPTPSPDIVSANNPKEKQDTNPGSQPAPTGRQGRPARVASSKTKDDDGKPEAPSIPSDKPEETIKPTATVDLPTLPLASPTVVSQPPEPSSSRVEVGASPNTTVGGETDLPLSPKPTSPLADTTTGVDDSSRAEKLGRPARLRQQRPASQGSPISESGEPLPTNDQPTSSQELPSSFSSPPLSSSEVQTTATALPVTAKGRRPGKGRLIGESDVVTATQDLAVEPQAAPTSTIVSAPAASETDDPQSKIRGGFAPRTRRPRPGVPVSSAEVESPVLESQSPGEVPSLTETLAPTAITTSAPETVSQSASTEAVIPDQQETKTRNFGKPPRVGRPRPGQLKPIESGTPEQGEQLPTEEVTKTRNFGRPPRTGRPRPDQPAPTESGTVGEQPPLEAPSVAPSPDIKTRKFGKPPRTGRPRPDQPAPTESGVTGGQPPQEEAPPSPETKTRKFGRPPRTGRPRPDKPEPTDIPSFTTISEVPSAEPTATATKKPRLGFGFPGRPFPGEQESKTRGGKGPRTRRPRPGQPEPTDTLAAPEEPTLPEETPSPTITDSPTAVPTTTRGRRPGFLTKLPGLPFPRPGGGKPKSPRPDRPRPGRPQPTNTLPVEGDEPDVPEEIPTATITAPPNVVPTTTTRRGGLFPGILTDVLPIPLPRPRPDRPNRPGRNNPKPKGPDPRPDQTQPGEQPPTATTQELPPTDSPSPRPDPPKKPGLDLNLPGIITRIAPKLPIFNPPTRTREPDGPSSATDLPATETTKRPPRLNLPFPIPIPVPDGPLSHIVAPIISAVTRKLPDVFTTGKPFPLKKPPIATVLPLPDPVDTLTRILPPLTDILPIPSPDPVPPPPVNSPKPPPPRPLPNPGNGGNGPPGATGRPVPDRPLVTKTAGEDGPRTPTESSTATSRGRTINRPSDSVTVSTNSRGVVVTVTPSRGNPAQPTVNNPQAGVTDPVSPTEEAMALTKSAEEDPGLFTDVPTTITTTFVETTQFSVTDSNGDVSLSTSTRTLTSTIETMTRVPRTATPKERDPGMIANEGMIGGIIGGVILVFAIIFLVLFLLRRRKQRRVKLETQLFNNAPPVTPISQRIATFSFRSSSTNSTVPSVRSPITPRLQYTQSVVNSSIISPSVSASSNSDDPFSDLHDVRTSGASSDTTVVGASLFAANTKTLLIAPTPSDPFSDPAGVRDSDPFSDPTVPTQYVTLNLEPENFGRYSFSSAGHSMGSSIRSGRSGHGVGDGKGDAKRLSDASSLNSSQFVVTQAI